MPRNFAIAFLITALAITSAVSSCFVSNVQATSGSGVSWLHTSGIDVYDESGKIVNLYGANVVYGQGQTLAVADLRNLEALGFNSFRTSFEYWGLMQPYNESMSGINVQYFATGVSVPFSQLSHPSHPALDYVVNLAVQENVYVMICIMPWTPWYAPPRWAFPSLPHSGPNQVLGDGTGQGQEAAKEQAYSALFNGIAAKERAGFINTWRFVANRYRDIPNVIFELLSEPSVAQASLAFAGTPYKAFLEEIISAIESVETRPHLKIVPLLRDHYDLEITDGSMDVSKPNVVWATHMFAPNMAAPYDPNGRYWRDDAFVWHGKYFPKGWGNGTLLIAWRLIRGAEKIHSWNRPWMNTEFSRVVTETYSRDWYDLVLLTMREQHVSGWQYFCYSSDLGKEPGWNINDPTVQSKLVSIMRPYLGNLHPTKRL